MFRESAFGSQLSSVATPLRAAVLLDSSFGVLRSAFCVPPGRGYDHPVSLLLGLFALLAIVIAAALLLAGAIVLLRRGRGGSSGALGAAMLEIQSMYEPSRRHAAEVLRAEHAESDESGDPPNK